MRASGTANLPTAMCATDETAGIPTTSNRRELFIASEVLLFGGLILGYFVHRHSYDADIAAATRHTDIVIGTANTAILLTSSFLVACAVDAASAETRKLVAMLLSGAILLGLTFIALKGVEYSNEYREHLVPGIDFSFDAAHA